MKRLLNAVCDKCHDFKPKCAHVAVNGTNAGGDREVRVMVLCYDCRKLVRGLYIVDPRHK